MTKSTFKFLGIIALTAIIGFSIISCEGLDDPIAISWTELTANGTAGTEDTTELTLTFDKSTSSLKIENITVTGAAKGALGGTGNTRTLSISDITVGDSEEITVTLTNPDIYDISPLSKKVVVYKKSTTGETDEGTSGDGWPPAAILTRFGIDDMPMPAGAEDVTWSISVYEDGTYEGLYIRYTDSGVVYNGTVYTWLAENGWSLDYSDDGSYTFLKGVRELQLVFRDDNDNKTIYVYSPLD